MSHLVDEPLPRDLCVRLKDIGLFPESKNLPLFTYMHGQEGLAAHFSAALLDNVDWLKETWAVTPLIALAWLSERFSLYVSINIKDGAQEPGDCWATDEDGEIEEIHTTPADLVRALVEVL